MSLRDRDHGRPDPTPRRALEALTRGYRSKGAQSLDAFLDEGDL